MMNVQDSTHVLTVNVYLFVMEIHVELVLNVMESTIVVFVNVQQDYQEIQRFPVLFLDVAVTQNVH